MKRIDTSTAVDNKFVDGNPTQGQKGTQVSAKFLNDVQEEISSVIEGANVPLGENDHQLLDVLKTKAIKIFVATSKEVGTTDEAEFAALKTYVHQGKMLDITLMFNAATATDSNKINVKMLVEGSVVSSYEYITPKDGCSCSIRFVHRNETTSLKEVTFKFKATSGNTIVINPTIYGSEQF